MATAAIFDGDAHELDCRRVSLVFNTTHGESSYPGREEITPERSIGYYAEMGEVDPVTAALFGIVVPDWAPKAVDRETLDESQPVFRQVAGMLALTVQAMLRRIPFVWKYPEAGLHPKYQANLADVAILLSDGKALETFLRSARLLH